ncbi:MAG: glycosyltransferase [Candidatus Brachytrichaceae bacterium NZ_4S206]
MVAKRIAIFLPSLAGGGAEHIIVQLANHFSQRGVSVDLVLAQNTGVWRDKVSPDVRVIDLRARRTVSALPWLIKYLRAAQPTCILATLLHANVVAALATALANTGIRLVLREANFFTEQKRRATKMNAKAALSLAAWAYRRAHRVVAVSQAMAEDLRNALGLPTEKVVTIHNPVDLDALQDAAKMPVDHRWLSNNADLPVILGVGRLEAQKDFATLLRAFAIVKAQRDCRLIILGEGALRGQLTALARELDVADSVDMPGFAKNPYAYLLRASVFVLSSAHEGMPNALIEALALGVPVVATNCRSGPAEILEDGRWGQLVPVGDVPAMANAILETLAKPLIQEAAICSVQDRFGIERVADQYFEVLLDGC